MTRSRPFWLPASNYYVLAFAVAVGSFFVLWGILHDTGDATPWITAGVGASFILAGAVVMRELILRRIRMRVLQQQRILASQPVGLPSGDHRRTGKLTLEAN